MTEPTTPPTVTPDPDGDGVVLHLPEITYLDTQVWSVDVGLTAEGLAALRELLAAYDAARTSTTEERIEVWPLARVLAEVRCGSRDWTWEEEWADLDQRHADTGYLATLEQKIRENGITMPVLVGSDGRLWDGHHRLRIAVRLGIGYVPVELTTPAPVDRTGLREMLAALHTINTMGECEHCGRSAPCPTMLAVEAAVLPATTRHNTDTSATPPPALTEEGRLRARVQVLEEDAERDQSLAATGARCLLRGHQGQIESGSAAIEGHRFALSTTLGLGTGAPWDAIHEQVAELRRRADETAATETEAPTTLTPTERTMLDYALDQAQERIWSDDGFTDEDQAAVDSLRRLTAEPAAGARQDGEGA